MASTLRKTNWFAIWVSVAAVVVLAVVTGIVIAINSAASGPGAAPSSQTVNTETGAIAFGSGSKTMDTYIDFMCPICGQFEQSYGSSIQGLVSDGTITLNVHPIAILDSRSQGTDYSSRAASAMYAVADADPAKAYAFMQGMFQNQPEEGSTGLTDDQIIAIAEGAGVNVTDALKADITSHKYAKYVQSMTPKTPVAPGSAGIGTPTIAINGTTIANSTLPEPAQLGTLFK
ncbi:thioredoxin domain-containing protein [Microbacterium sp. SYP-A9085]|uniref:DsbA family protein n=1 Tax=Microbacterium sp. SYP-A9085 TaxID=2664454 RepID=UPI00129AA1D1|nr:thioredoxin domain-containing protein [Microbacterium sp. SYP-A9085]MRH29180.1 thioredoxin domain-containing protein [Microbacterium sp. SYP-A9085]